MAKVSSHTDQANMPQNGRWSWNDTLNQLEYTSTLPGSERQDKKGKKLGQQKQGGAQDRKKDNRGTTPASKPYTRGRQTRVPGAHPTSKQGDTHVTLAYLKEVSLRCLQGDEYDEEFEETIYQTEQFDEFLMYLLNYFHWFYEKLAQDNKNDPMSIEPSRREVEYYEELGRQVEAAQKQLGRAYCVLVLGVGLEPVHHMACGMSRVSSTYRDRRMFEKLYSFLAYLVWIAFRHKDYDMCKKEIGRILRSDTFNPSLRVKLAPEQTEKNGEGEDESTAVKLTPAQYRRIQGRRPPIKSIINQRSPALVSIMPDPREEANWLFSRSGAISPTSIVKESLEDDVATRFKHLDMDKSTLKVGIIGEPLNLFNKITLTPLGAENEDEEDGEDKTKGSRKGSAAMASAEQAPSRQPTAISMATTEGHLSDGD